MQFNVHIFNECIESEESRAYLGGVGVGRP